MLKEAELVRELKDQAVQCRVCEHYCTLHPGDWGKCGVRVNRDGKIYLAVYGSAVAAHVDPIEKKPLFHFLPGSRAFSIGTYGCNMRCAWCQNWQISQVRQVDTRHNSVRDALSPEEVVETALRHHSASIAYTYNEPTVFFEYTYDTAKLAREHGLKNVYVSNGFMSPETLERLAPYLDGINVDLKGFTNELYEQYSGARLEPIKRNIAAIAHETNIWIEVTTLVTLERGYAIGKAAGLRYIYLGNVFDPKHESTVCPACDTVLIERYGYNTRVHWVTPGVCPTCNTRVPGVWS
jgi:pyruvate formate lyase activating enzyme